MLILITAIIILIQTLNNGESLQTNNVPIAGCDLIFSMGIFITKQFTYSRFVL